MSKIPGTEIDKPKVNLTNLRGLEMQAAKRALHKAGAPDAVVIEFLQASAREYGDDEKVRAVIRRYVEVVEPKEGGDRERRA